MVQEGCVGYVEVLLEDEGSEKNASNNLTTSGRSVGQESEWMVNWAVKKTLVGWLGYIGDYTTPIIPGSIIGHYIRILKNQPKLKKEGTRSFFSLLSGWGW